MVGLGANIPEDSVYPTARMDGDGKPLDVDNYVWHLEKGQTPTYQEFWSATMYNAESFFVPNAINRHNVVDWMPLKLTPMGHWIFTSKRKRRARTMKPPRPTAERSR